MSRRRQRKAPHSAIGGAPTVESAPTARPADDARYRPRVAGPTPNTPELRRPASHNLDAAVHYLPSSDAYELIVGGTNLTNDRYLTTGSINLGASQMSGTFNAPRQWYVSVRANFGAK